MPTNKGAQPAGSLPSQGPGRQTPPPKDGSSQARPSNPRRAPAAPPSGPRRHEAASSGRTGRRPADPTPPPPFAPPPPPAVTYALHGLSSLSSSNLGQQQQQQQHQHPEQAYLACALRRQDDRAMGLFQSLRQVEERLLVIQPAAAAEDPGGGGGGEGRGSDRRRLRKEAALLRRRLAEAEQQGRLILLRLGDLHVEQQQQQQQQQQRQQQRQRQREQQRQQQRQRVMAAPVLPVVYSQPFWGAGAGCAAESDAPLWRAHGGAGPRVAPGRWVQAEEVAQALLVPGVACPPEAPLLSPLSPVFEPRVKFSAVISWKCDGLGDFKSAEGEQVREGIDPLCRAGVQRQDDQARSAKSICQDAVTAWDEKGRDGEGGQGGRRHHKNGLSGFHTCIKRPSSPFLRIWSGRRCGGRSVSMDTFSLYCCPKPRDKRMSIPSLESIWHGEARPL